MSLQIDKSLKINLTAAKWCIKSVFQFIFSIVKQSLYNTYDLVFFFAESQVEFKPTGPLEIGVELI